MPVQTRIEKVTTARNALRGAKKRLEPGRVYRMRGEPWSTEEIVAAYEAQLAAIQAVGRAWAAWQEALAAERKLRGPTLRLTVGLRGVVYREYGPRALADFGWDAPKKPGPKTVKAKLAGVEKRRKNRR